MKVSLVTKVFIWLFAAVVGLALFFPVITPPNFPASISHVLDSPERAVLYSVSPSYQNAPSAPGQELFHGYPVLGKIELAGEQATIAAQAFQTAVSPNEKQSTMRLGVWWLGLEEHTAKNCIFSPRHALQVVDGGHTFDFVLCYQCGDLVVFQDGKLSVAINAGSGKPETLNNLLMAAHVPLPPPSPKR